VGGEITVVLGYDGATALPLDTLAPLVSWAQEVYAFTGRFAYGARSVLVQEVMDRGGWVEDDVSQRTTFLVIGSFGSRDWRQTAYGRKIQQAVKLRDTGFALRIVGEDHWAKALRAAGV
jgi:hypothetical protein